MVKMSLNITVPDSLKGFIEAEVRKGGFPNADEYVRTLIQDAERRKVAHETKREELRKEIAIGIEQADRGETSPLNMEAIKARVREQLANRKKADASSS